jgi:hypothetical protein
MVATVNFFEVMTSTLQNKTLGSVASLLAATLYQGNPDRNHKLWNIVSSERYILHAGAAGMLLHINGKFTMEKLYTDRQRPQRQIHKVIQLHAYSSLLFTKNRNMCHRSMTYATME